MALSRSIPIASKGFEEVLYSLTAAYCTDMLFVDLKMMLICACDAGDDREGYEDRKVVSGGGTSASNSSARETLVKDQELMIYERVLRFTNVSPDPLELELCDELGDVLVYFSQTNTQPSEVDMQFKLDTRVAAGSRRYVHAFTEANASCELQNLYSRVLGVGRLNRFWVMLSLKSPEGALIRALMYYNSKSILKPLTNLVFISKLQRVPYFGIKV